MKMKIEADNFMLFSIFSSQALQHLPYMSNKEKITDNSSCRVLFSLLDAGSENAERIHSLLCGMLRLI